MAAEDKAGALQRGKKFSLKASHVMMLSCALLIVAIFIAVKRQSPGQKIAAQDSAFSAAKKSTPVTLKEVARVFYSDQEYAEFFNKRGCSFGTVCDDFHLAESEFEGVTEISPEVVIFFNGPKHSSEPVFSGINAKDAFTLSALHHLAKSELFYHFSNQELAQIHLVLMKNATQIEEVLRVHVDEFGGKDSREPFLLDLQFALKAQTASGLLEQYKIKRKSDE